MPAKKSDYVVERSEERSVEEERQRKEKERNK